MTLQLTEPFFIALRIHKGPLPPGSIMQMVGIGVSALIYILFKERVFPGIFKWIVSGGLFSFGIISQFICNNRWDRFVCWCVASALVSCVLLEVLKKYVINNRRDYVPPDEKMDETLSDQEEFEIHKIALVILILWFVIGLFVTK